MTAKNTDRFDHIGVCLTCRLPSPDISEIGEIRINLWRQFPHSGWPKFGKQTSDRFALSRIGKSAIWRLYVCIVASCQRPDTDGQIVGAYNPSADPAQNP